MFDSTNWGVHLESAVWSCRPPNVLAGTSPPAPHLPIQPPPLLLYHAKILHCLISEVSLHLWPSSGPCFQWKDQWVALGGQRALLGGVCPRVAKYSKHRDNSQWIPKRGKNTHVPNWTSQQWGMEEYWRCDSGRCSSSRSSWRWHSDPIDGQTRGRSGI